LIDGPNSEFQFRASGSSSTVGLKITYSWGMTSFSATDRATKCDMPVASSTSHPSAARATVSYCASMYSATRRVRSSAVDGRTHERHGRPNGTSGTPTPASSSTNSSSGGAHTRTSAPSARSCTASPTIGSTSPRDPYVDNNTRISRLPRRQVLASAGDSAA
jgi:hypothetical protein